MQDELSTGIVVEEEKHPTMLTHSYKPPVDKLLTYTSIKGDDPLPKISYVEKLGIGPEHIPELILMATDEYLGSDDTNDFEFTGPLHAVMALAELHAKEAIEPLLMLYDKASQHENEWMLETLVDVYTIIGPVALPSLEQFLADSSHDNSAQSYVAEIIGRIAKQHPESREECIAVITRRLKDFEMNDPDLNTSLISDLLTMKVVEAAPLIQEVYASNRVDESWVGDWDEVQYELGLKERPAIKERSSFLSPPSMSAQSTISVSNTFVSRSTKKSPTSKKVKAKMAKASKKANRKKK